MHIAPGVAKIEKGRLQHGTLSLGLLGIEYSIRSTHISALPDRDGYGSAWMMLFGTRTVLARALMAHASQTLLP